MAAPMLELARIAEYSGFSPAGGIARCSPIPIRWGEVTLRANAKPPPTSNRRFDACLLIPGEVASESGMMSRTDPI